VQLYAELPVPDGWQEADTGRYQYYRWGCAAQDSGKADPCCATKEATLMTRIRSAPLALINQIVLQVGAS